MKVISTICDRFLIPINALPRLKEELISISRGDVESELHNIFNKGLRKERGQLKLLEKFGPVKLRENEVTHSLIVSITCRSQCGNASCC